MALIPERIFFRSSTVQFVYFLTHTNLSCSITAVSSCFVACFHADLPASVSLQRTVISLTCTSVSTNSRARSTAAFRASLLLESTKLYGLPLDLHSPPLLTKTSPELRYRLIILSTVATLIPTSTATFIYIFEVRSNMVVILTRFSIDERRRISTACETISLVNQKTTELRIRNMFVRVRESVTWSLCP